MDRNNIRSFPTPQRPRVVPPRTSLDKTVFEGKEPTEKEPLIDKNITIRAYRKTVRKLEITWSELPPEYFKTPTSQAILEISDAQNDGFKEVHRIGLYDPPFYLDEETKVTYYRSPIAFYRIRFPESGIESRVFSSEKEHNQYGAEIARRHEIQLKEGHAGNLMYLFTRKKFQERCPDCWDDIRGTRSKANCRTCLNTGFIGGYYKPVGIYVSTSPENNHLQQSVDGVVITGGIQCWTAGFPRLQMGDVIVDPGTQDIYHVQQVNLTTHKRVVTKQEFQLMHQDEDIGIMELFNRIPREAMGKDIRHGEQLY